MLNLPYKGTFQFVQQDPYCIHFDRQSHLVNTRTRNHKSQSSPFLHTFCTTDFHPDRLSIDQFSQPKKVKKTEDWLRGKIVVKFSFQTD